MAALAPINDGRLLRQRAYHAIREAIIDIELKPGEQLTERVLTERLGVSKSPIRDALIQLEQEGLVRSTPFKGFEVVPITEDGLRYVFQFWAAIEPYCVEHFALRRTDAQLAELEQIYRSHDRFLAMPEPLANYERSRFHPMLIESLENPLVSAASRTFEGQYARVRRIASTVPGRVVRTQAEHGLIVEAIRARDAGAARERTRKHLESVLTDTLAAIDLETVNRFRFK